MTYDLQRLGEAIEGALKASGVSKTELVKKVDKTWPTIQNWCNGKHPPTFSDLVAISELTGTPIGDLVNSGAPDESRSPYPAWAEFLETEEAKRIAERWMIEQLGALRVRPGKQPTVETYKRWLFAMLSVEGESVEPTLTDSDSDE